MPKSSYKYGIKTYDSLNEGLARERLLKYFKSCPIPDNQIMSNLALFLSSKNLSRILFMNYLYQKIIDTQGIIIEFGTRWGQNLALFSALRGIYEPFNRHRKIVGFDTFKGFPSISEKDGGSDIMKKGNLTVVENYFGYLYKLLEIHEKNNPLSHIKKFDLRPGDAAVELKKYLKEYPQTIIALVYFDLDLYEPTKRCLKSIRPYLTKGSVLGFDELNDPDSPGETIALREVFSSENIRIKRYRYASRVSYFVLE